MSAPTVAPAAPEPRPVPRQYDPARATEIERLCWAAGLAAEECIAAYGSLPQPRNGGAS